MKKLYLFKMMRAAITPGTQPRMVRRPTINIDPHPRSYTARGGKRMAKITRPNDMIFFFDLFFVSLSLQKYNFVSKNQKLDS